MFDWTMQQTISTGQFNFTSAVMMMSRFCAIPRVGHLERLKGIIGYLCKFIQYRICFRTKELDYTIIQDTTESWDFEVYKDAREILTNDAPPPKGNRVTMTSYFDANLMHNILSGKVYTGILHLFNGTLTYWSIFQEASTYLQIKILCC